ncbi:hypothetical protein [Saccharothrix texasensis]|uniref:hypothetical protein n=1 Tax=Saccharothrix texasensis TaxID=103734 RepID=UPI0014772A90|nr:hypothetical protein [Saccharothrix texasensis]
MDVVDGQRDALSPLQAQTLGQVVSSDLVDGSGRRRAVGSAKRPGSNATVIDSP